MAKREQTIDEFVQKINLQSHNQHVSAVNKYYIYIYELFPKLFPSCVSKTFFLEGTLIRQGFSCSLSFTK